MNHVDASPAVSSRFAYYLAVNGVLLMLTGLVVGAAIPAAPFPRLMLAAHIGFVLNGAMSVFAALLVKSSLAVVGTWSGTTVLLGHVGLWALCISEVAAAFWGANQALVIAAGQAGAAGAEPWQETLVTACHVVAAALLIAAWVVLAWGVIRARREPSAAN